MRFCAAFHRSRRHVPRGASLIELMVSMALVAVVLSVTVGLVSDSLRNGARGLARGELARQGEYLNTVMRNELRLAGLGVPKRLHIDDGYGLGDTKFDTVVIVATSTAVGIVADLPRPDAQYNTFGILHDHPTGGTNRIMWHTENNGVCATSDCNTGDSSIFFLGENGCDSAGTTDALDRTCPWGMRRVVALERIQVVSGAGRWTHAEVNNPLTLGAYTASSTVSGTSASIRYLALSTSWSSSAWPNVTKADAPTAVGGQGFVTTLDRVFFYLDNGKVMRIQCFGDPAPQDPNWPELERNERPSLAELQAVDPSGSAPNVCIGPEVIATNVGGLAFQYYTTGGSSTTDKEQIRRIDWTITLEKNAVNRTVRQNVVGTVALRNWN